MNSINWTCLKTWKESAYNTLWCLVGCSIGDFGTIFYFQSIDHSLSIYLVMILAIFNGLITSVLLETFILIKKMKFIDALKTALGMTNYQRLTRDLYINKKDEIY